MSVQSDRADNPSLSTMLYDLPKMDKTSKVQSSVISSLSSDNPTATYLFKDNFEIKPLNLSSVVSNPHFEETITLPLQVNIIKTNETKHYTTAVSLESIIGCQCLSKCLTGRYFPFINIGLNPKEKPCQINYNYPVPNNYTYLLMDTVLDYTYQYPQ